MADENDVIPESSPAEADATSTESSTEQTVEAQVDQTEAKTDDVSDKSMLDVVQETLKAKEEPSSSEPQAKAETAPPEAADPDGQQETEPDESKFSEGAQKRIRELNARMKDAEARAADVAEKAERLDKLSGFVAQHGISEQDIDGSLELTALVYNNPAEAYRRLTPIMQRLAQQTGQVLPNDLAEEVRDGFLTEPRARELSQQRATAQMATQQAEQLRQQQVRSAQERQMTDLQTVLTTTADQWVAQQSQTDPDFAQKQDDILVRAKAASFEKLPRTAAETTEMLNGIKKEVDARYAKLQPRKPIQPVQGRPAQPSSAPEPKSIEDIIRQQAGMR